MAGKKALGAWFQRCTAELGDIGIGTFRKFMTSLVDSTMLYGAEVWGCCRNLQSVQQVQLRAARLFFGVGTLHPRTSLLLELGDLPVVWLARMKCCSYIIIIIIIIIIIVIIIMSIIMFIMFIPHALMIRH